MTLQTLLIHPAVQSVGWALLHFVWQGCVLAVLFLAVDALTRRSPARVRYAISCMAMLLMPAVFVATIFWNHPFEAPVSSAPFTVPVVAPGVDGPRLESSPKSGEATVATIRPSWHPSFMDRENALPGLVVCLWLAGLAALSIYAAAGWLRVQRLKQRGAEPVLKDLVQVLEELMRQLQVSRPVRMCASAIAEVPTVIGWLHPCILLPLSAITGLSESQLRAVLAHELAHIRRHDYLVNLMQTAVETLLFYHPAVWWVSRRVRQEREHCCDDLAVAVCGDAPLYAAALAELEESRGRVSAPALAATGGDLVERIRRVLGLHDEKRWDRVPGSVGVAMAFALVLCAGIGAGSAPAIRVQPPLPRTHQAPRIPQAAEASPVSVAQAARPQPPASKPRVEVATVQTKLATKLPEFEVASIKPVTPNVPHMMGVKVYPGGRVTIHTLSLKALIVTAFRLSFWQVSGLEPWGEKDEYDLEGKPPENLQASIKDLRYTWWGIEDEQLRGMLQALLIDRFQLKYHRETKTGDVYLLEPSGKTLALHPAEIRAADPDLPETRDAFSSIGYVDARWSLYNYSMPQLTRFASDVYLHATVLDRTGLTGSFDYKQIEPDLEPKYGDDNPESFLNMISALGLKLQRAKGPVEVFVIDHAAKPSAN